MPTKTDQTREKTDAPATADRASKTTRPRFECRLLGPAAGGPFDAAHGRSIELNGVQFKDGVAELDNPLVAHALANTGAVDVIDRETGKAYDGQRHPAK